jgi:hypothetical protein
MTPERFRSLDLTLRVRPPLLVLRAWGLTALAGLFVLEWWRRAGDAGLFWPLCVLPAALLVGWAWYSLANAPLHEVTGPTIVTGEALIHAGKVLARRKHLDQGFVLQVKDVWLVQLTKRSIVFGRSLVFAVPTLQEGTGLLRALALSADQTTARVKVASRFRGLPSERQQLLSLALLGGPLLYGVFHWGLLVTGGVWCVAAGVLAGLYLLPASVHIGVDGLVIRWLTREQLLRFEVIHRYEQVVDESILTQVGLRIHLHGGRTLWLPVGLHEPEGIARTSALAVRLHQAMSAARRGHRVDAVEALERRARPFAEWVTALRRVGAGANGDHRNAFVGVETLRSLVEDASRSASERAAAAIALVEAAPEERSRIGALAKTTVSAPLARVLSYAAAGWAEDLAVVEALAELEADESRERRPEGAP